MALWLSTTSWSPAPARRYPPFAQGLAADTPSIRTSYAREEAALPVMLGLPADTAARELTPVLERLAAWVHWLPAGTRHYRHAGGLYHYGLTVAMLALRFAESRLFAQDAPPAERCRQAPGWRRVIFYAGLGQALTPLVGGLQVRDSAGATVWNPYREALAAWLSRDAASRYTWQWVEATPLHACRRLLLVPLIFPPATLTGLGRSLQDILLASLAGLPNPIQELIEAAVAASLAQDQAAQAHDPAAQTERLVERLLSILPAVLAALPNPPFRQDDDRIYLDWATVAVPLVEALRQTRALELPPDANLLARLLQAQGLAEPGPRPGWLRLLDPAVFPGEASG